MQQILNVNILQRLSEGFDLTVISRLYSLCRCIHQYSLIIKTSSGGEMSSTAVERPFWLPHRTQWETRGGRERHGENGLPNRLRVLLDDNIMSQEYLLSSTAPQSPSPWMFNWHAACCQRSIPTPPRWLVPASTPKEITPNSFSSMTKTAKPSLRSQCCLKHTCWLTTGTNRCGL